MSKELDQAWAALLENVMTGKLRRYTSPYSGDYRETLRDPEPSTHSDPRMHLTLGDMARMHPTPGPVDADGKKITLPLISSKF